MQLVSLLTQNVSLLSHSHPWFLGRSLLFHPSLASVHHPSILGLEVPAGRRGKIGQCVAQENYTLHYGTPVKHFSQFSTILNILEPGTV